MNYDLHQTIAGYLEVVIGLLLGFVIFFITKRYESRNAKRTRLLDIQSKLSTAYAGICDARWICRPNPNDTQSYHHMLALIGQHRGVMVDSRHELRNAKLLKGRQLEDTQEMLKMIDLYLLSLLKESTQFNAENGEPIMSSIPVAPFDDEHPLYKDFISEWSTRSKKGLSCVAAEQLRIPFHQIRDTLEKAII